MASPAPGTSPVGANGLALPGAMRVLCRRLLVAMFSMCRGGGFSVAGMAKRAVSYPKFTRRDASLGIFPIHFPFYPVIFFLGLFFTLIQKKACNLVTMAFVLDLDMCWIVFYFFRFFYLILRITVSRLLGPMTSLKCLSFIKLTVFNFSVDFVSFLMSSAVRV